MRNLIIKRHKTVVGSAATLKIYISDPCAPELTIHGTPCRCLAQIRNGQTLYIPIGDGQARIYVIADALSREMDCEYCDLPAGCQDIYLSGKCRFDPMGGNPFHFDGNRMSPRKGSVAGKIAIAVLGFAVLFGIGMAARFLPEYLVQQRLKQPQTFSAEGMQIKLTKEFKEMDASQYGFTLGYASKDTAIYILKESFSMTQGLKDLTLDEYAQLVIDNNGMRAQGSAQHEQGLTIFEYTTYNYAEGEDYAYVIVFVKGPDAFWLFEFATQEDNAEAMRQTYLDYAKTICFPDGAI